MYLECLNNKPFGGLTGWLARGLTIVAVGVLYIAVLFLSQLHSSPHHPNHISIGFSSLSLYIYIYNIYINLSTNIYIYISICSYLSKNISWKVLGLTKKGMTKKNKKRTIFHKFIPRPEHLLHRFHSFCFNPSKPEIGIVLSCFEYKWNVGRDSKYMKVNMKKSKCYKISAVRWQQKFNGLGAGVLIPGRVIPKSQIMVHDSSLV